MLDGSNFGEHLVVCRFPKGVLNRVHPCLNTLKYGMWQRFSVEYLKTLSSAKELRLKMLTKKVTMLLCLLTGQDAKQYIDLAPDIYKN